MVKRIVGMLLLFAICITTTSCTSTYPIGKYGKVKSKIEVNGPSLRKYNGNLYVLDEWRLFESMTPSGKPYSENKECVPEGDAAAGDVLVGWTPSLYFYKYYSNTEDNPVFIYEANFDKLYIRDDYDYKTDTFIIEGTDHSFVFSDMLTFLDGPRDDYFHLGLGSPNAIDVFLYSEFCPRLRIYLKLNYVNDMWIANVYGNGYYWFELSDELLQMLNIDSATLDS